MSESERAKQGAVPRYRYPDALTAEGRAEMDRTLPVDGDAYLRWLAGDGPDPCAPEPSR
jgi:hypothetical protein